MIKISLQGMALFWSEFTLGDPFGMYPLGAGLTLLKRGGSSDSMVARGVVKRTGISNFQIEDIA